MLEPHSIVLVTDSAVASKLLCPVPVLHQSLQDTAVLLVEAVLPEKHHVDPAKKKFKQRFTKIL